MMAMVLLTNDNTYLVTLPHPSLDPDILPSLRSGDIVQRTCPWHETVVGILGIDPGLK